MAIISIITENDVVYQGVQIHPMRNNAEPILFSTGADNAHIDYFAPHSDFLSWLEAKRGGKIAIGRTETDTMLNAVNDVQAFMTDLYYAHVEDCW